MVAPDSQVMRSLKIDLTTSFSKLVRTTELLVYPTKNLYFYKKALVSENEAQTPPSSVKSSGLQVEKNISNSEPYVRESLPSSFTSARSKHVNWLLSVKIT